MPRITAFLEAITEAYRLCDPGDRGELITNAHFLSWLGRVLPSEIVVRTRVICMVQGRSFVCFERVRVFLAACTDTAGAATMPEPLRAALRALSFEVRLGYIGLCRDDYDARVQTVRNEVRAILLGDREPCSELSRSPRRRTANAPTRSSGSRATRWLGSRISDLRIRAQDVRPRSSARSRAVRACR